MILDDDDVAQGETDLLIIKTVQARNIRYA